MEREDSNCLDSTRDVEGEIRDVAGDWHFLERFARSLYGLVQIPVCFSLAGGIDNLEGEGLIRGRSGSSESLGRSDELY